MDNGKLGKYHKQQNLSRQIMKNFFSKNYKVYFLFYLLYTCFSIINSPRNLEGVPLTNVYFTVYLELIFLFVVLPLFIFTIMNVFIPYDHHLVITKFSYIRQWYESKLITLLVMNISFVLLLNTIFIVVLIVNNQMTSIDLNFLSSWITGIILQINGFLTVSFIYLLLRYMLNNRMMAGIFCYLLFLVPYIVKGLFYEKIFSFFEFLFYGIFSGYNMFAIMQIIVLNVLLITLIYYILRKKDFTWSYTND